MAEATDDLCAIRSCDNSFFRAQLCEAHYREILSAEQSTADSSAPSILQTTLYVVNRFTFNVIEGYRNLTTVPAPNGAPRTPPPQTPAQTPNGGSNGNAASLTPRGMLRIANDHAREGRYEDALAMYRKLAERDPERPGVAALMGHTLNQLGHHQQAIEQLTVAVAQQPKEAASYYELGIAHEALDDAEAAVNDFRQACKLAPDDAEFQQALGFAYESLGQHEKALACFKKAITLER